MDASSPVSSDESVTTPTPGELPCHPWWHWRRLGLNFLTVSILMHFLLGIGATYFVVQRLVAKPKATFVASAPSASAAAVREHKVQMQKKQQTMSAPTQIKRVSAAVPNAAVVLPAMPAMPALTASLSPVRMAGMGGSGLGMTLGGGSGAPGGGGKGVSLFGLRTNNQGLRGTFYDLKQTPAKAPSAIKDLGAFVRQLDHFLQGGWNEASLSQFYKAPQPLYATQIMVPRIDSAEAPKAFGVEKEAQPSLWMALYKGRVSPPESGTYYFVGGGDNILIVRLDGRIVLDKSWNYQALFGIDKNWKPTAAYDYGFASVPGGFSRGLPMQLSAGDYYNIEVLIGDDGGAAFFSLLVEKQGAEYPKANNLPLLPVFRVVADPPPPGEQPPFQPNGPIWKSRSPSL